MALRPSALSAMLNQEGLEDSNIGPQWIVDDQRGSLFLERCSTVVRTSKPCKYTVRLDTLAVERSAFE